MFANETGSQIQTNATVTVMHVHLDQRNWFACLGEY